MQRIFGIDEHRNPLNSCHRLSEDFHPLAGEFRAGEREASHVAAGTSEAHRKAEPKRVGGRRHNNWNARGLAFCRECWWRTDDDDSVWTEGHQLRRKLVVCLRLTEREPVFDCETLTLT